MNKIIVNSVLAAGLLAFAPIQSQAGSTIDQSMVSPLQVKLVGQYVNGKNKIVKVTITSKDILFDLGAPKGSQLVYWENSVAVINNKTVWDNDVVGIDANSYTDNTVYGNEGSSKYTENGLANLSYYGNSFNFDVNGVYNYVWKETGVKNGKYSATEKFHSSSLTGDGYDAISDWSLPVTGSFSASGSGRFPAN